MRDKTAGRLQEIINYMILSGYLVKTADKFTLLRLGPRAQEALAADAEILMKVSQAKDVDKPVAAYRPVGPVLAVDRTMLDALKALRQEIAKEQGLPAFVIFHDSSLTDMCMRRPTDYAEFLGVSGVGKVKADNYGARFLEVIAQFAGKASTAVNVAKSYNAADVEISEDPVTIKVIADRINCVLMECGQSTFTGQQINDRLVAQGYLKVIQHAGKNFKVATAMGEGIGIVTEERVIREQPAFVNLFDSNAQRVVCENLGLGE